MVILTKDTDTKYILNSTSFESISFGKVKSDLVDVTIVHYIELSLVLLLIVNKNVRVMLADTKSTPC